MRGRRAALLLAATLAIGAAADPPPADAADPGIRYLHLVRHGHYRRDPRADDLTANGLDALGQDQARRVGRRLARLPVRIARLVTSDFTRARETAAIMARELRLAAEPDTLIRECTPPYAGAEADLEAAACTARLEAAWARHVRPAGSGDVHEVLVCHGNVIRWFVGRALGLDPLRWRALEIANASITVIAVHPDGATRVALHSDVGHLPESRQTWTGRGPGWSPALPAR